MRVLVTGGDSGLGAALVDEVRRARRPGALAPTSTRVDGAGRRPGDVTPDTRRLDVTSDEDWAAAVSG